MTGTLKPQTRATLALLRRRGRDGLTPLEAFTALGSMRLGARVWELKDAGYEVHTDLVSTASGKRVARYTLIENQQLTLDGAA